MRRHKWWQIETQHEILSEPWIPSGCRQLLAVQRESICHELQLIFSCSSQVPPIRDSTMKTSNTKPMFLRVMWNKKIVWYWGEGLPKKSTCHSIWGGSSTLMILPVLKLRAIWTWCLRSCYGLVASLSVLIIDDYIWLQGWGWGGWGKWGWCWW